MARLKLIVPREQPEVAEELARELSGEDVSVVVDRRRGERRQTTAEQQKLERRRAKRRGQPPGPSEAAPEPPSA